MRLLFGLVLIIMNDVPRLRYIFRQRRKPHTAEQCSEQMSGGQVKVMTQDIQNFIQYLHQEKNTSENTEVSYARDLKKMNQYLLTQGSAM